jgi:hypothetical protein
MVWDLLSSSSGQPIIQAVLDGPTVQRSGSFGSTENVSKHFAVGRGSLQDGASGGDGSLTATYM